MLLLLIAAAAPLSPPAAVLPDRQARATVRIARPAVLRFAAIEQSEPRRLRSTQVRDHEGALLPARLVEFE